MNCPTEDSLPRTSLGILSASLLDVVVVYDLVKEVRHLLNPAAGSILQRCDGAADLQDTTAEFAGQAGVTLQTMAEQIDDALRQFCDLGLVGRTTDWLPPAPRTGIGPTDSPAVVFGADHRIIDLEVRFRGTDATLIEQIDTYLGMGAVHPGQQPAPSTSTPTTSIDIEVVRGPDGSVELWTDEVERYDQPSTLLLRLHAVLSEYAATTHGWAVLHAGGVRAPAGGIVVLPSVADGGKSTLTAALVRGGWDYLSDEAIGIRHGRMALGFPKPLRLDPAVRPMIGAPFSPDFNVSPSVIRHDVERLGGPAGQVNLVVFPTFHPGAALMLEELSPLDTLDALLANTINLARVGQPGLASLCELAESAPAYRLVHGNAIEAAATIEELLSSFERVEDPTGET